MSDLLTKLSYRAKQLSRTSKGRKRYPAEFCTLARATVFQCGVQATAAATGVSRSTLYKWVDSASPPRRRNPVPAALLEKTPAKEIVPQFRELGTIPTVSLQASPSFSSTADRIEVVRQDGARIILHGDTQVKLAIVSQVLRGGR